jgi:hypothetical protein
VLRLVELRHVDEALDPLRQLHERAEVGQTNDFAFHLIADVVL